MKLKATVSENIKTEDVNKKSTRYNAFAKKTLHCLPPWEAWPPKVLGFWLRSQSKFTALFVCQNVSEKKNLAECHWRGPGQDFSQTLSALIDRHQVILSISQMMLPKTLQNQLILKGESINYPESCRIWQCLTCWKQTIKSVAISPHITKKASLSARKSEFDSLHAALTGGNRLFASWPVMKVHEPWGNFCRVWRRAPTSSKRKQTNLASFFWLRVLEQLAETGRVLQGTFAEKLAWLACFCPKLIGGLGQTIPRAIRIEEDHTRCCSLLASWASVSKWSI